MDTNKKYLPLTLDITGQRILVVGGGPDAAKKVKILQRFTSDIDVLTNQPSLELKQTGVHILSQGYEEKLLLAYVLVYVSTADTVLEQQVIEDGIKLRVLINVHDKPDRCQFISPAIFQYKNITVAVGSNGQNVYESIKIRDEVANYLNNHYFKN